MLANILSFIVLLCFSPFSLSDSVAYFDNTANILYLPEVNAGNLGSYNANLKLTAINPIVFALDQLIETTSTGNPVAVYQNATGMLSVLSAQVGTKLYQAQFKTVNAGSFELNSLTEIAAPYANQHRADRMLIVISAPSIHDSYYKKSFNQIIDFDIQYANAVIGKDNIVVLADKDTLPYFKGKLPEDVLLESTIEDIWLRDFSTAHPTKMVKFAYDRPQESSIEQSFLHFMIENNLSFTPSSLKVDGGNIVDNNHNKVILTEKVFERNPTLSPTQIIATLKTELAATEIAVIPMDEEYLGHADGMVMFIDDNTVIMNDYNEEPDFKAIVFNALQKALPTVKIHEITGAGYGEQYGNYASACGIYVNSVVTNHYIYMPIFGNEQDAIVLQKMRSLTDKTVVTVNAQNICFLGGNTRCLSWQLTGDNAQKIIEAARNK